MLGGAEWYAGLGTPKNGGTRLFCLAGNLQRPGVYELPMGYNLQKMIYDVGGGIPNGRALKAVVPGGSSTPVLLPEEIDVAMDFDSVAKTGSMLGSGGVVVLDDTNCIVKFALRTIKFYQHESCGWCIPCREGTDWLKKTLTRLHAGGGMMKDIDNIQYLSENMITVACVATLLFLGGWSGPLFGPPLLQVLLPVFWFLLKVVGFLFIYIWVRGTLPRFRYDQLMAFGWKFLLPLAIANIVVTALIVALRS